MKLNISKTFLIKLIFINALLITSINAKIIDGIAITVNEEPVLLSDITNKVKETGLSKADAVSVMIDEILYNQEVKNQNIDVDIFEVNEHIEKIASRNGMDLYAFKSILRQRGQSLEAFEQKTKEELIKRKLISKLIRGNLNIATQDDIELFYENNKNLFTTAANIKVTEFKTKNRRSLVTLQRNPMALVEDVNRANIEFKNEELNPKVRFLLNEAKVNSFTPIFTANKNYVMFYITEKSGITNLALNDVKEKVFNIIMGDREKKFLKEYFEKLKLTADIKVIR